MKMKKRAVLLLLGAFLFTSCGAASIGNSKPKEAAYDMAVIEEQQMEAEAYYDTPTGLSFDYDYAAEESESMPAESGSHTDSSSPAKNDLSSRKIIKNANVSFETKEYDEFMTALNRCIVSHGGYVESTEAYGGGIYGVRSRSSYITARIPADRYEPFMTAACELGTLTYRSENAQDVTMSYLDAESRLKSLRTEYDALLEILEKAESLEDVITLQSRISEVTYEIESYESSLRKYDDLISYCTIRIDISEVAKETPNVEVMTFSERIRDGLEDTFLDLSEGFTDFAVWFVTSLPYLLIWAAVIVVLVLLIRAIARKHRRKVEKKQKEQIEQYLKQQGNEKLQEQKKDNT